MVEKFLEHIDAMPAPPADDEETAKKAPTKKSAPATKEADDGFEIEGFSGSMFAKF
jgi:hypothetical protein